MYLHKCAGYNEGSMKAFAKRLIDDNATQVINLIDNVSSLLNEHEPDNAVKLMAYEYKWDLRKNWMPDEEFLKGYTQEALIRIGNEIGYNMKNLPKKSQKVEALIKEFATGTKKADQWLPSE